MLPSTAAHRAQHPGRPHDGSARRRAVRWLAALCSAAALAATPAQPPPETRLRIVGGLAQVNQYTRHEEPFWTQTLPTLSAGRLQAEIVPFDRAGIRGQDMLRLLQLGVVPFGTVLLELAQADAPLLAAPDLPGLSPDLAALRRHLAAYRPLLTAQLRERYGIELLAVYAYPAQALYCRAAFASLTDLAGRRVRVAGGAQANLVAALGAVPVLTTFAELPAQMRAGKLDCAITGTMSGNTIGLHESTSHLSPLALSWGVSLFGANGATWAALPPALRELLQAQLPKLEKAVWDEAGHETGEGIACNTGAAGCTGGRRGRMTLVAPPAGDLQRLRRLLAEAVLPAWVARCGTPCAEAWNQTLAPVVGIDVRP